MAIFDQNIYQGVQDSLIRPGSEFWENWLEPAITGGILRMSQKDIITHFREKFPIFIEDNILSCDSTYDTVTLKTDNLPNKYVPGLVGINWPRAEIYMDGPSIDFEQQGFKYITCHTLNAFNIDEISNVNIRTNYLCGFTNIKKLTNVTFGGTVRFHGDLPEIDNRFSTEPIDLVIFVMSGSSNPYINELYQQVGTVTSTQYRRKRWVAPHPIEISDIVNVSNIQPNRISLLFDNRISARAEFTRCKGISKSNIRGWDAFYWIECP